MKDDKADNKMPGRYETKLVFSVSVIIVCLYYLLTYKHMTNSQEKSLLVITMVSDGQDDS